MGVSLQKHDARSCVSPSGGPRRANVGPPWGLLFLDRHRLVMWFQAPLTVTLIIFTGVRGRSSLSVGVCSIFFTTSMPEITRPNTGCLDAPGVKKSRNALWTVLMKNWQLPLLGAPVFAMESVPGSLESFA